MARRKGSDPLAALFKLLGALLGALFKPAPARAEPRMSPRPAAQGANGAQRAAPRPVKTTPHRWPALGDFDFSVVGESHYQQALAAIAGHAPPGQPFEVQLVAEVDNPHDKMAVSVRHGGAVIGHLSREDARSYRRRLSAMRIGAQPATCDAMLTGGYEKAEGRALFGVLLDIKPFD